MYRHQIHITLLTANPTQPWMLVSTLVARLSGYALLTEDTCGIKEINHPILDAVLGSTAIQPVPQEAPSLPEPPQELKW